MHATEVVVGEMQSNRSFHVRKFLAESVCEPRQSAHSHANREVLPLHVASADADSGCPVAPWI
jgi:hypothetical protein